METRLNNHRWTLFVNYSNDWQLDGECMDLPLFQVRTTKGKWKDHPVTLSSIRQPYSSWTFSSDAWTSTTISGSLGGEGVFPCLCCKWSHSGGLDVWLNPRNTTPRMETVRFFVDAENECFWIFEILIMWLCQVLNEIFNVKIQVPILTVKTRAKSLHILFWCLQLWIKKSHKLSSIWCYLPWVGQNVREGESSLGILLNTWNSVWKVFKSFRLEGLEKYFIHAWVEICNPWERVCGISREHPCVYPMKVAVFKAEVVMA